MKAAPLSIVSALCTLACIASQAQTTELNTTTTSGEYARYSVYYNWHFIWLNAAEVFFSTTKQNIGQQPTYKLQATGRTLGGYDHFYYVCDTFISVTDTLTLQPLSFYQSCYEGSRITRNTYNYDAENNRIGGTEYIKEGRTLKSNKPISLTWDGLSFDVMTMVYKARNINFAQYNVDDKIPIRMIINSEVFKLYIRYMGKEIITTKHGDTFHCLKFSPLLVEGTIFSGGEAMTVWVTDDDKRVPVVVEAKILIGSVKAILAEYNR